MKDPETALRSTPITQSTKQNRINGVFFIIVCGVAALWLWNSSHGFWAIIALLVAVFLFWTQVVKGYGEATATCPLCDKTLQLAALGKHNRCPWCFAYSERDRTIERLSEVEEGRIEAKPTFLFPLQKTYRFPQICCVCGRSASGSAVTHATYNLKLEWLPGKKHLEYSLDLPYCELHAHSKEIDVETALDSRPKKADEKVWKSVPGLKVSSYRFYREFLRLNGIKAYVEPEISFFDAGSSM
jgi:hypothetical protein